MKEELRAQGNILVVDDTPATIRMIKTTLEHEGFQVFVATSGEKTIQRAELIRPDIILLDILLPGMDGYETCKQLKSRKSTQDIPVIFLSALAETFDKVKGFSFGAVDYVTKPIETEELSARVKTHLTLRRLQCELQNANRVLEERVASRTLALSQSNDALRQEVEERKRVAEELRKAKDAADVAHRAKSEFIANISHELRTPLNHVLGFAQLLDRQVGLPLQQKSWVKRIIQGGDHLLMIINDLINLATIETGKMALTTEELCFSDFLKKMTEMFSLRAEQKGIAFEVHLDPGLPYSVYGDAPRLRQILLNILGNAVKFTPLGKVVFRVKVRRDHVSEQEKGERPLTPNIRFEVEDTGIGISPEQCDRIFSAFYQVGDKLSMQTEGTGLGLTISQRLVRMMGSELHVQSTPGTGSTFWFDLELPTTMSMNKRHAGLEYKRGDPQHRDIPCEKFPEG